MRSRYVIGNINGRSNGTCQFRDIFGVVEDVQVVEKLPLIATISFFFKKINQTPQLGCNSWASSSGLRGCTSWAGLQQPDIIIIGMKLSQGADSRRLLLAPASETAIRGGEATAGEWDPSRGRSGKYSMCAVDVRAVLDEQRGAAGPEHRSPAARPSIKAQQQRTARPQQLGCNSSVAATAQGCNS